MSLSERSKQVRRDAYHLSKANGGYHYGGSFSCAEILIALYDHVLNLKTPLPGPLPASAERENTPLEDRFILSKGHGCWCYYVLLRERGLNPKLEGHPHLDLANGVHWTTGSEGHGFPAGVGMAFARKKMGKPGHVYVLMGDGECQEGTTWESLLIAAKWELNNLTVIVDWNDIQGSGRIFGILPGTILSLEAAASAAGWLVVRMDGHNVDLLCERLPIFGQDQPTLILARTVKGKGVDFMQDQPCWHAKWPNAAEERVLLAQLASNGRPGEPSLPK